MKKKTIKHVSIFQSGMNVTWRRAGVPGTEVSIGFADTPAIKEPDEFELEEKGHLAHKRLNLKSFSTKLAKAIDDL